MPVSQLLSGINSSVPLSFRQIVTGPTAGQTQFIHCLAFNGSMAPVRVRQLATTAAWTTTALFTQEVEDQTFGGLTGATTHDVDFTIPGNGSVAITGVLTGTANQTQTFTSQAVGTASVTLTPPSGLAAVSLVSVTATGNTLGTLTLTGNVVSFTALTVAADVVVVYRAGTGAQTELMNFPTNSVETLHRTSVGANNFLFSATA